MSEMNPTPPIPPTGPIVPGTSGVPAYMGPEPDKDSKTMAMLAHLLGILTGPIGALIVWMMKKDQLPFVNDQGKEALNFQITVAIAWVALIVIWFVGWVTLIISCLATLLMIGLFVTNAIFCIIAGMKANKGIVYRYPINLNLVK